MASFVSKLVAAAVAGLMLCAAPAAMARVDGDVAPVMSTDPAKIALGEQIVVNLRMVEIYVMGAKTGVMDDETLASASQADKDRLLTAIDQAAARHRPALIHDLAAGNVDRFTIAELEDILTLSKIKYFQDVVMSGADDSLPEPDPATMNATESAFFAKMDTVPYGIDFLDNFNVDAGEDELTAALEEAFEEYYGQSGT